MTTTTKFDIGRKVWIMRNNKPHESIISNIRIDVLINSNSNFIKNNQHISDFDYYNQEQLTIITYLIYSIEYQESEYQESDYNKHFFDSKEELLASL